MLTPQTIVLVIGRKVLKRDNIEFTCVTFYTKIENDKMITHAIRHNTYVCSVCLYSEINVMKIVLMNWLKICWKVIISALSLHNDFVYFYVVIPFHLLSLYSIFFVVYVCSISRKKKQSQMLKGLPKDTNRNMTVNFFLHGSSSII